jgi:hypothetical protein
VAGDDAGLGGPVVALPVGEVGRLLVSHALPPDVAVIGEGDVGEDRVALLDGAHGVGVGVLAGAGRDAEQAELGVDGIQPAVGPKRIQAMSSPTISASQPSRVGSIIARLVLPQALGKAPAM